MRSAVSWVLLGLSSLAIAGCPARTLLDPQDQAILRHQLHGRVFFLKYANFVGPFFEYTDRQYLSERAFDERVLLENPAGEPILAPQPTRVLPMGAKVRIHQIDFPTQSALATRKLRSPRHFTWVLVDQLEPPPGPNATPLVLVLTQEFRTPLQFEQALETVLVEDDPRSAFADRTPEELRAIDHKTLIQSMRPDALIRSRGHPDRVTRTTEHGVQVERWEYGPHRSVVLKNDRVDSWRGFAKPPIRADSSSL
jgi:hypothetical protein